GVKTGLYKMGAFVISGFLIGLAGAAYAYYIGIISPPSAFDPSFDITIALMAFLGGIGTLWGPLLGAVLLEPLQQYITIQFGGNGLDLIIYGSLFLAILLLWPEGIVPSLRRRWAAWMTSRRAVSPLVNTTTQEQTLLQEQPLLTERGER
ncbi:MAG: branched-chain amino acid ABC transporter permease, partial [Chloroflexota bacterium]|nr:branched-chain amino acid ABC transporter permease [Chloroflexota bacterium]